MKFQHARIATFSFYGKIQDELHFYFLFGNVGEGVKLEGMSCKLILNYTRTL